MRDHDAKEKVGQGAFFTKKELGDITTSDTNDKWCNMMATTLTGQQVDHETFEDHIAAVSAPFSTIINTDNQNEIQDMLKRELKLLLDKLYEKYAPLSTSVKEYRKISTKKLLK